MFCLNDPDISQGSQQFADEHSQQHDNQWSGQRQSLQILRVFPQQEQSDAGQTYNHRPVMQVSEERREFGEGVLMVGLNERHFPLGVGIVPQQVGNLLQDQDQTDCREQPLDDAARDKRRQETRSQQTEVICSRPANITATRKPS